MDEEACGGPTPLFTAVRMLSVDCTRALLLDYGADPQHLPLPDACRWLAKRRRKCGDNAPAAAIVDALLELLTRRERLLAVLMGSMERAILAARGCPSARPRSALHLLPPDLLHALVAPRVMRAE